MHHYIISACTAAAVGDVVVVHVVQAGFIGIESQGRLLYGID